MGLREKRLAKPHLAVLARCPRLRLEGPWDESGPSRPSSKTNALIWWRAIGLSRCQERETLPDTHST